MNVQVSKSNSKKRKRKLETLIFLLVSYLLEVFLMLSTTFLEKNQKILLGLESCLINACVKKSTFI
jgi:hypothetical protein